MLALGMDDVHGPPEVINGIPLKVATPLSSVKRCCSDETFNYFSKFRSIYLQSIKKAIIRVEDHNMDECARVCVCVFCYNSIVTTIGEGDLNPRCLRQKYQEVPIELETNTSR